mmetsp:Transcript_11908/g.49888  ORF Transcript_11908/g.49888 Transcript_11908/m.49888 type:complete len:244 (-) Transcript_11908:503-1234(-)
MTNFHGDVPTLLRVALGTLQGVRRATVAVSREPGKKRPSADLRAGRGFRLGAASRGSGAPVPVAKTGLVVATRRRAPDETARVPLPLARALPPLLQHGAKHATPLAGSRQLDAGVDRAQKPSLQTQIRTGAVALRDARVELRAVDLRDGPRRDGARVHPREDLFELLGAVRAFEDFLRATPGVLRRARLQLLQLLAQLRREHVVPGARPLPPLDERGAAELERLAKHLVPQLGAAVAEEVRVQ